MDHDAWTLCDDSLVVDLMKIEPRVVLDAMRGSASRGILPHWNSSGTATGASQWHYNHSPKPPATLGCRLPPSPESGEARHSVTENVNRRGYRDWAAVWECAKRLLQIPRGCELLRIYQNTYPYGADGCVHTDSNASDEVTMCLFLHPTWDTDWGGESVLLDPQGEIHRAVLPRPGRLFAFRSATPHAARPTARAAVPARTVLVLKMGPWPVRQPVALAAPDAVTHARIRRPSAEPAYEGMAINDTDDGTRRALAIQWVLESRALRTPHGRTSLGAHLVTTAAWLQSWNTSEATVLGGLGHALCGTQTFRPRCFDPVKDRLEIEAVLTPEGTAMALAFASCDRSELEALIRNPPDGAGPFTLKRDPHGPEGAAEFGPLLVTSEMLEGLIYIQAANQLSLARIENCLVFDRARRHTE